jgi:hypothetical protein
MIIVVLEIGTLLSLIVIYLNVCMDVSRGGGGGLSLVYCWQYEDSQHNITQRCGFGLLTLEI